MVKGIFLGSEWGKFVECHRPDQRKCAAIFLRLMSNRLSSTKDSSGGVADTYTMDAWGNRQESGTFSFIQPFGPANQIGATGYVYDSSGNLTADGLGNTYSYDADGKMSASNGAVYTRDSFGQRVRKDDGGAATEYFYFGGELLATRDPSTSQWTDYIYAGESADCRDSRDGNGYAFLSHRRPFGFPCPEDGQHGQCVGHKRRVSLR